MKIRQLVALGILMLYAPTANAYFIVAVETGSVFCTHDNKVEKSGPRNKAYYEVNPKAGTITRTKVVVIGTGEVIPDKTIYQIISPADQISINSENKVIHAVGRPGSAAYELLTLGKTNITQAKSTGDYVVVFHSKIIESSDTSGK